MNNLKLNCLNFSLLLPRNIGILAVAVVALGATVALYRPGVKSDSAVHIQNGFYIIMYTYNYINMHICSYVCMHVDMDTANIAVACSEWLHLQAITFTSTTSK